MLFDFTEQNDAACAESDSRRLFSHPSLSAHLQSELSYVQYLNFWNQNLYGHDRCSWLQMGVPLLDTDDQ